MFPVLQMRNMSSEITQVVEEDVKPGLSDFRILPPLLYPVVSQLRQDVLRKKGAPAFEVCRPTCLCRTC